MYLLDTNVLSELRKVNTGTADKQFASWARSARPHEHFISAMTLLELEVGVLLIERRDTEQGKVLRTWMNDQVLSVFADRTLNIDLDVSLRCAALHVTEPRPERDALIAATALVHGMTVVTRNVADFEPMGVPIFNPWQALKR
jgi:predicted nucleic acid-binding protein